MRLTIAVVIALCALSNCGVARNQATQPSGARTSALNAQGNPTKETVESVPFVGCRSDGFTGSFEAPKDTPQAVQLSSVHAERLALYSAQGGPSVLAPRGWSCLGNFGSSGSMLYVTPGPVVVDKGIEGFGIQASFFNGETSGRFSVAAIAARVFPTAKPFVDGVMADALAPQFEFGPYPTDVLKYLNDQIVEFETPPHTKGLGSETGLVPNNNPIRGVAILKQQGIGVFHLSLRLPPNMDSLVPVIIREFEGK